MRVPWVGGRRRLVYGHWRLDGRQAALLDLRSDAIHPIDPAVLVQGWTDASES